MGQFTGPYGRLGILPETDIQQIGMVIKEDLQ